MTYPSCISEADNVAIIESEGPLTHLRPDEAALQMLSTTISWELAAILALACLVFCLSAVTVLMVRRLAGTEAATWGGRGAGAAMPNTHLAFLDEAGDLVVPDEAQDDVRY